MQGTSEQAVDSNEGHKNSKRYQLSDRREGLIVVDALDHVKSTANHTGLIETVGLHSVHPLTCEQVGTYKKLMDVPHIAVAHN